jgi:hypothetical protein
MEERRTTKAERRQAAAAGQPGKADRKQAKLRRRQQAGSAARPAEPSDQSSGDAIQSSLARLEQAVAAQSQLSEQLLAKLDEVLHETRKSEPG